MVELLAPAGTMASFYAAINAGADAIYLAGEKYGARAYAGNFSNEELLEALRIAHLLNKKIYMTINTLLKESELSDIVSYLTPFYQAGLDGVIVQDFGAMKVMQKAFPDLELHASTQMTVTGSYGAQKLKEKGICRVVPARELSLSEIKVIKEKTGLEIESFIHGAMCYSYSGQCLFSSILGQRSGNRGRCAGPCRLPYDTFLGEDKLNQKDEMFQLGLKDLCTLEILPKLIDAGIDSFKIEGRMKSPAYVYFITHIYRKNIDQYLQNPSSYNVDKNEIEKLKLFFSRGDLQSGYYESHNGRHMVTLSHSGYGTSSNENVAKIKKTSETNLFMNSGTSYVLPKNLEKDIDESKKRHITGYFNATIDTPVSFTVLCDDYSVTVQSDCPSKAQNRSASEQDVKKQLSKTGGTAFLFDEIYVELSDGLFLPNKELNELRRNAICKLQEQILSDTKRTLKHNYTLEQELENSQKCLISKSVHVSVLNINQLFALKNWYLEHDADTIDRLYLSYDMILDSKNKFQFRDLNQDSVFKEIEFLKDKGILIYLRMPAVIRKSTTDKLAKNFEKFEKILTVFDGVCVNNLEALGYLKDINLPIVSDSRFYIFQAESADFFADENIYEHILSYELHNKEMKDLLEKTIKKNHRYILPVYGRIPLMESAGCVLKTNKNCLAEKKTEEIKKKEKKQTDYNNDTSIFLYDRYHKKMPVITHCDRCDNTIYNSVPLSLHKEMDIIESLPLLATLVEFTIEKETEMYSVLDAYCRTDKRISYDPKDFTKGHFLKGVE